METPHESGRADLIRELFGEARRFPLLLGLSQLLARGIDLDTATLDLVSAYTGQPVRKVEPVAAFVTSLREPGAIRICKSVSCTGNGAEALHSELVTILADLASPLEQEIVYCLDECERGPSLAVGDRIYTGTEEEVVADERPWRHDP